MKNFTVFIIMLLFLVSCSSTGTNSQLKVGIIAPLTGPNAWIGELIEQSAEMGIEHANVAGGVNDLPIEFVLEDADTSAEASTAANKLISQDSVDVIYAITTPNTAAASAVAEQHEIPLFGFTAVPTFAKKGKWTFIDLRNIETECTLLGETALNQGHVKIAL